MLIHLLPKQYLNSLTRFGNMTCTLNSQLDKLFKNIHVHIEPDEALVTIIIMTLQLNYVHCLIKMLTI